MDFLNIPVGAYSAATGQGNLAGIEGPEAIFGNPAMIGRTAGGFASYQELLTDTRSEAFAVGLKLPGYYSAAFGFHIFQPGEINGYSSENIKTDNIKAGDYLARLGISSNGILSYGLSFSFYGQRLHDQTAYGYGLGFGLSYETGFGRLALSAENIGPDFRIGESSSPLPQRYSISGWIPIRNRFLNLNTDFYFSRESGFGIAGGLEYSPTPGFYLRAGGNLEVPIALGLGINANRIGFDYSYMPSELFGDRHLFSLSYPR